MGQYRMERLGEQLRQEISSMILTHQIKDPRVNEFISVNRVDVSGDLSYAKVYVSSFMDDNSVRRATRGLQSAAGFIQCTIAKKLTIYKFPKLTFIADFSLKEGYKMVQKLNALENQDAEAEKESQ
ncbi:MAG: 30S ribosome-binding factor RbfA [Treponema sp.]|nr:30S ribosome-binding factor RbfA [Treponema sp.]MBQ2552893.1 30S ribosome-binding factor RbfA [Treponema sp.]MBQ4235634.1 30S ribosome-binding factor RbfA [Treponema sp.]MBQ5384731.1 30S ribosome-binding factor RbfA [Treponema sp.]